MVITFYGLEFFKIQFGDTTVAFNPFSKESRHKNVRFGADIVLESLRHPDFNGDENMSHGGKEPFVVTGPGEYEVKGVIMRGFPATSHYDGVSWHSTVYSITLENMNLCFFGPLDEKELSQSTNETLEEIDVLFVPAPSHEEGVLDAEAAYKLAVKYEPKVIIPMHYTDLKEDGLKTFLKEGGSENDKPREKVTLKRKDVDSMEGDVVLLKPNS